MKLKPLYLASPLACVLDLPSYVTALQEGGLSSQPQTGLRKRPSLCGPACGGREREREREEKEKVEPPWEEGEEADGGEREDLTIVVRMENEGAFTKGSMAWLMYCTVHTYVILNSSSNSPALPK